MSRELKDIMLRRLENEDHRPGSTAMRKGKLIMYNNTLDAILDANVVTVQRYGCFGTNLFPGKITDMQLTAGVTSANAREGKTLVAANLAAFFATDSRDDTVLIDLNFRRPKLHDVFGVPSSPGIMESLRCDTITLTRTPIKGLWVLPLGFADFGPITFDKVLELRESIETLKRQFRFIVLDLPSAFQNDFPAMISSQLDGFFVVVAAGRTKVTDIRRIMQTLNENKVIGFVMNGARPS
ncbi:MAG: CpsD/CapB family tyrosine-protein kinase [Bacteroidota bacterium]